MADLPPNLPPTPRTPLETCRDSRRPKSKRLFLLLDKPVAWLAVFSSSTLSVTSIQLHSHEMSMDDNAYSSNPGSFASVPPPPPPKHYPSLSLQRLPSLSSALKPFSPLSPVRRKPLPSNAIPVCPVARPTSHPKTRSDSNLCLPGPAVSRPLPVHFFLPSADLTDQGHNNSLPQPSRAEIQMRVV